MSVDSTHVVFTLRGEERLLRLPLERLMRDSVIRGEGFEFYTQVLVGTRYGATKSLFEFYHRRYFWLRPSDFCTRRGRQWGPIGE